MAAVSITPSTLSFLRDLKKHNDRPWFNENKDRYVAAHQNMIDFADVLIAEMSKYDRLVPMTGKKSLFRIYRDVRFSKDKSPYKMNFAGGLKRATRQRRGGYYYHIEPSGSFAGGGFWGPSSGDIKHIRKQIAADPKRLRKIINSSRFKKSFGSLDGEQLKTAPQGFEKDHPAIDLLRHKQFLISKRFTAKEVTDSTFLKKLVHTFKEMLPFFDYMSEILSTDLNGTPLFPDEK
ncbi:MAG: DUF2461 domain-containing protein [Saprospiraceae bacterium]|nr:DUF2461 domain-containing protein [Saprospiraceae bacterium]